MSAASATLAGRRAAERLMVDACTVTRGGARGAFNATTGQYAAGSSSSVYSGACRVVPNETDRVVDAGEQPVSLFPFTVSLPISAEGVEVDDLVTVTASALDPALVGQVMRVRYVAAGSHITARRLGCEVNAG